MALKRNVLIFHSGALGDFILSWPLAMAAGRIFAQSRVFYVTTAQKGRLAERALRLEWVDAEAGWHTLFADKPALPDVPARLLAGAHSVVSFVAEPGSKWEANVREAAPGAEVLCLAAHPPIDFVGHHTEYLLHQLSPSLVWLNGVAQMINSLHGRGLGHAPPADGPVVIHPGGGSPTKCWPLERFTELAESLKAGGRQVRFIVGEVEQERWSAEDFEALRRVAPVDRLTSLTDLLDRLKQASAFVGNDSGPGHLAGVLGLPTVSIFGHTNTEHWRPLGPHVAVVKADVLCDLSCDRVIEAMSSVSVPAASRHVPAVAADED